MKIKLQTKILVLIILLGLTFTSCSTVKPYQRVYLDDSEMSFGVQHAEKFELKAFQFREGAIDIIKSKSSGGCGCN